MANSTIDVILKILDHLDKSMDDDEVNVEPIMPEALGITEARWSRVIGMMLEEGLIDGFKDVTSLDSAYEEYIPSMPRITFKGLNYLSENTGFSKLYRAAKEIKDWIK